MQTVQWTSTVGVLEENDTLKAIQVDNDTYRNILSGKWIKEEIYEELKNNGFKLLLINENGENTAVRTFGARFALFTGNVRNN